MPDSQLREVLTDARDLISEHGWVQMKLGSRGGGFCIAGALVHATELQCLRQKQEGDRFVRNRLGDSFKHIARVLDGDNIIDWNDAEGRTQEEVLELLELAIEAA